MEHAAGMGEEAGLAGRHEGGDGAQVGDADADRAVPAGGTSSRRRGDDLVDEIVDHDADGTRVDDHVVQLGRGIG